MIRVDDLTGAQLDLAVAHALGWAAELLVPDRCWARVDNGNLTLFEPSSDWSVAGPIIQQHLIGLSPPTSRVHRHGGPNAGWGASGVWTASTWSAPRRSAWHATDPLVAAMRCFVKSRLGDEITC
jgi:hypothetical protein